MTLKEQYGQYLPTTWDRQPHEIETMLEAPPQVSDVTGVSPMAISGARKAYPSREYSSAIQQGMEELLGPMESMAQDEKVIPVTRNLVRGILSAVLTSPAAMVESPLTIPEDVLGMLASAGKNLYGAVGSPIDFSKTPYRLSKKSVPRSYPMFKGESESNIQPSLTAETPRKLPSLTESSWVPLPETDTTQQAALHRIGENPAEIPLAALTLLGIAKGLRGPKMRVTNLTERMAEVSPEAPIGPVEAAKIEPTPTPKAEPTVPTEVPKPLQPPSQVEAVKGKEPWEMTRNEFRKLMVEGRKEEVQKFEKQYRAVSSFENATLPEAMNQYAVDFSYENKALVKRFRNIKPEDDVILYRSISILDPEKTIEPGDWVALERQYASMHGQLGEQKPRMITKKAKAKDVVWAGTSADEYLYAPERFKNKDIHSTHEMVINDALQSGKPVPPEIIADYPDLAAKYGEPPAKPPTEPLTPKAPKSPEAIGLRVKDIEEIRSEMGMPPIPKAKHPKLAESRQTAIDEQLPAKAKDIADDVMKTGRTITEEEHAGMVLRTDELRKEFASAEAEAVKLAETGNEGGAALARSRRDMFMQEIEEITQAARQSGGIVGSQLSTIRLRINPENMELATIVREAREVSGRNLSEPEIAQFRDIADKYKVLEKQILEFQQRDETAFMRGLKSQAESVAQLEIKKARISMKAAGQRERILLERTEIKKQLQDLGYRLNDVTGVTLEGSYLIGKLAVNYIKEGVVDLAEVVRKVMADIPGIAERDVWQGMNARDPKRMAIERTVKQRQLSNLKTESRLLDEIDKASQGIFKETKPRPEMPSRIRALQNQLSELRRQAYVRDPSAKVDRAIQTINELTDQLEGFKRNVRRRKPIDPPELTAYKAKIVDLRKQMRTQDNILDLEEQLRTGNLKIDPKRESVVSEATMKLQIEQKKLRLRKRDAVENLRKRTMLQKGGELINLSRTAKTIGDVSTTFRQNLVLVSKRMFTDPGRLGKDFGKSVRAMFSDEYAMRLDHEMRQEPKQFLRDQAKLELPEPDGPVSTREEFFNSRLAEKIPVYGSIVRGSARHMRVFGNLMRKTEFDRYLDIFPDASIEELQHWANVINVFSGRGDLGKWSPQGASTIFFAPRFAMSRIQTPYMMIKYRKNPRMRKEIAKYYASLGALATGVMGLAKLSGYDLSDDPTDPDFGKIKVGNTRFDIWGGYQQPMRLLVRLANFPAARAGLTEAEKADPLEIVFRFAAFKMSPAITIPRELMTGEDIVGQPTSVLKTMANTVTPLVLDDIRDAYKLEGGKRAFAVGLATEFGIGATTYVQSRRTTLQKTRERFRSGDIEGAMKDMRDFNKTKPPDSLITLNQLAVPPEDATKEEVRRLMELRDKALELERITQRGK